MTRIGRQRGSALRPGEDGIHAAITTIDGAVKPGTDFDPDNIAELFGRRDA